MVYCKKDQKADIDISREGKKMKNAPAYVKVYSRLKNEINKGTYPVGGFLPKECELEKIYQVSRTTVRNAVKILVQEGLVEVRQGSGTRVLNHKAIQNYNGHGIPDEKRISGNDVRYDDRHHFGGQTARR